MELSCNVWTICYFIIFIRNCIYYQQSLLDYVTLVPRNIFNTIKSKMFLLFTARGKKKKKLKKLLPLLLLLKLKFAALIPLFLGIIAFVAIKAVFLGKIAFAMSAFSLIRKLLAKKGSSSSSSISYAAPQHHEEHPGYSYEPASQGWSRKASDGASLAYAGQISN